MTKHPRFSKAKHGKKTHPVLSIVLIALLIPVLGFGLLLMTFDINSYRGSIEQAVHDQTGRTIKLAGPISWSLSLSHGFSLAISDVTVSNPSWASRPDMAKVGNAKLHLDVMALMQKNLNIVAFELSKTDVQLETSASGTANWDFTPPQTKEEKAEAKKDEQTAKKESAAPVSINVNEVKITDSRFGIKGADGKLSLFEVPELTFSGNGKGIRLHFNGSVAGAAVEVDMTGGRMDQITKSKWPFNLQATYSGIKIDARGSLTEGAKKVVLDEYMVTSGGTTLSGDMTVALGGARPVINGKITSKRIDPADFKIEGEAAPQASSSSGAKDGAESKADGKLFSREPIVLDGLKAADAHLDVSVDELIVGLTTAQQVTGKLDLENGRLALSPLTAMVAGSKTNVDVKVDASAPTALVAFALKSPTLDMSQLFKLGGMESVISGKTDVDIDVTTSGRSAHDFAAHANGKVNLLMDTGTVSSSGLRDLAGNLLDIFAPGAGSLTKPGVNCMAARYVITNGLMDTKGMLIDTEMTTIAGKGFVNLPDERIGISLYTKPKGLGLGSMIPPMRISGDLAKPSFALDAAGAVEKITGLITNTAQTNDGVPNLVTMPGKNTCAATLDNPNAPAPSKGPLVPGQTGNLKDAVKDLGGKLMKGVGGGLFGN